MAQREDLTIAGLKDILGAGARPYLFVVDIPFPDAAGGGVAQRQSRYLIRSTNLPGRTIDALIIPFVGLEKKIGGVSTFTEWTATFSVDTNFKIRHWFEQWMNMIHDPENNAHGLPEHYQKDIKAVQLNFNMEQIYTYTLKNAWPSQMAEIALAHDNKEMEQFDVTFTYDYHTYSDSTN